MTQRRVARSAGIRPFRPHSRVKRIANAMRTSHSARAFRARMRDAESVNYSLACQREACRVRPGARLRQFRAASISDSLAPLLRAHISAADAEYLAT